MCRRESCFCSTTFSLSSDANLGNVKLSKSLISIILLSRILCSALEVHSIRFFRAFVIRSSIRTPIYASSAKLNEGLLTDLR